jgi:hypothetical protein
LVPEAHAEIEKMLDGIGGSRRWSVQVLRMR